ncbi:hypothetical protein GCM10027570_48810 [Streptomonospora sediminis]
MRLRRGLWVRTLHWGVFRVLGYGTLASPLKRAVVAAQLALAPGAFACRETAARLWRLDGLPPWDGCTVHMGLRWRPGGPGGRGAGAVSPAVRVHSLRIGEGEVVRHAPIRLTEVGRTLRDMSECSGKNTHTRLRGAAVGRGLVPSGAAKGLPRRKRAICRNRWLPAARDSGDGSAGPARPGEDGAASRDPGPNRPTGKQE